MTETDQNSQKIARIEEVDKCHLPENMNRCEAASRSEKIVRKETEDNSSEKGSINFDIQNEDNKNINNPKEVSLTYFIEKPNINSTLKVNPISSNANSKSPTVKQIISTFENFNPTCKPGQKTSKPQTPRNKLKKPEHKANCTGNPSTATTTTNTGTGRKKSKPVPSTIKKSKLNTPTFNYRKISEHFRPRVESIAEHNTQISDNDQISKVKVKEKLNSQLLKPPQEPS